MAIFEIASLHFPKGLKSQVSKVFDRVQAEAEIKALDSLPREITNIGHDIKRQLAQHSTDFIIGIKLGLVNDDIVAKLPYIGYLIPPTLGFSFSDNGTLECDTPMGYTYTRISLTQVVLSSKKESKIFDISDLPRGALFTDSNNGPAFIYVEKLVGGFVRQFNETKPIKEITERYKSTRLKNLLLALTSEVAKLLANPDLLENQIDEKTQEELNIYALVKATLRQIFPTKGLNIHTIIEDEPVILFGKNKIVAGNFRKYKYHKSGEGFVDGYSVGNVFIEGEDSIFSLPSNISVAEISMYISGLLRDAQHLKTFELNDLLLTEFSSARTRIKRNLLKI